MCPARSFLDRHLSTLRLRNRSERNSVKVVHGAMRVTPGAAPPGAGPQSSLLVIWARRRGPDLVGPVMLDGRLT